MYFRGGKGCFNFSLMQQDRVVKGRREFRKILELVKISRSLTRLINYLLKSISFGI